jgi:hypothetical protein
MAQEQTFRSPNYYDREIDRSTIAPTNPVGTPAGVIGTSNKGPAFVPVTVGNFDEFRTIFGDLDPTKFGPYAVNEFLKHRTALTFLKVLGAGANETDGDIATTLTTGRVKNAGVKIEGNPASHDNMGRHNGVVQYLVARHAWSTNESFGMPMFTDNDSCGASEGSMLRGMIITPSGSRVMILDGDESAVGAFTGSNPDTATMVNSRFKLVISSTLGNEFTNTDSNPGVRIFSASLDPSSTDYYAKVLNTDPNRFVADQHYLYADFPVDNELAVPTTVGILSGSEKTSLTSGESTTTMREAFGAFDTRYTVPASPMFISQPFGTTEYDLFHFEALDDGAYANTLYKIAISNIKASVDDSYRYGTFTIEVRDWNDTDSNAVVIERFPNCSLDPNSDNYVAKVIGDRKVTYNFDATVEGERRVIALGKYNNVSQRVRVVVSDAVEQKKIPDIVLPFGFRGHELLKTNDSLTDSGEETPRLAGVDPDTTALLDVLTGSIVPPVPFRYKVTRGEIPTTGGFPGDPGPTELTNNSLYWGVKFERNTDPLNANLSSEENKLLESYTKFIGIRKLDVLVTGSGADTINNNKFSLSRVALSNGSINDLTASVNNHMKEAAYLRDAKPDPTEYTVNDGTLTNRITMGTILAKDSAANFNRFVGFNKFVTFMQGGYDGNNFLDRDSTRMNDRATSFDAGGAAESSYVAPGLLTAPNGFGQENNAVVSYRTALGLMTDGQLVNHNILAMPGIRESFLTELAAQRVRDYGLAYYVMDIPSYDDLTVRLFDDDSVRPDVEQTANQFDSRAVDANYAGTYFPDCFIDDETNRRRVKVPSSIPAMGALAFNDRVGYVWFAPAGFNRAALDFVKNVDVRLSSPDRDRLYESRINPIATFPRTGFVVWGQKTLQIANTALNRVNVRRLLLEVKRGVIATANKIVFEQNNATTRNKFVSEATLQLALIQTQQGVEDFRVVMNETNNTQQDIDLNRVNGRVVVVPTRAVEFISIDFVITNAGVEFSV